jgi:hypothetical protein
MELPASGLLPTEPKPAAPHAPLADVGTGGPA